MSLSTNLPWDLAKNRWPAELNPLLALPIVNGNTIKGVNLVASVPLVVNHLLQRMPQGWFLIDNMANAVIWRTQALNVLTITLESSADTTISFYIF